MRLKLGVSGWQAAGGSVQGEAELFHGINYVGAERGVKS
jgi:hypothetical protein